MFFEINGKLSYKNKEVYLWEDRFTKDFIEDVVRTFCDKGTGEEQACELLGLFTSGLYRWREKYLTCIKGKKKPNFKVTKFRLWWLRTKDG